MTLLNEEKIHKYRILKKEGIYDQKPSFYMRKTALG